MAPPKKAEREALRAEMHDLGLGAAEIARELARRHGLRPREAFRLAHGWSLDTACAHANDLAARLDPDRASLLVVSRLWDYEQWPRRGRRPPDHVLRLLAYLYGTEVGELLDVEDYRDLPEDRRPAPPAAQPFRLPVNGPTTTGRSALEPARSRDLAAVTGVDNRVLQTAAAESALLRDLARDSSAGRDTLQALHDDLVRIAHAYVHDPLGPLFVDLLHIRDTAAQLLAGRQSPSEARDLYLIAGRACALLSYASEDYGQHRAALVHARTAAECATRAGHPALQAWIHAAGSSIAYWAGNPVEADRQAQAGLHVVAGGSHGTLPVFLAALRARACGRLGDGAGATAALEAAVRARDGAGSGDEIGGVFAFPDAKQALYAASTHLDLDRPGPAREAATRALHLYTAGDDRDRSYGDLAGARLDLAAAHLSEGHVEGAAHALDPVLDLPPELLVSSVRDRCRRIRGALRAQHAHRPAARALMDKIAALPPAEPALAPVVRPTVPPARRPAAPAYPLPSNGSVAG